MPDIHKHDTMIPLDSDLLRAFLAVAETGSVTLAADRLNRKREKSNPASRVRIIWMFPFPIRGERETG